MRGLQLECHEQLKEIAASGGIIWLRAKLRCCVDIQDLTGQDPSQVRKGQPEVSTDRGIHYGGRLG